MLPASLFLTIMHGNLFPVFDSQIQHNANTFVHPRISFGWRALLDVSGRVRVIMCEELITYRFITNIKIGDGNKIKFNAYFGL